MKRSAQKPSTKNEAPAEGGGFSFGSASIFADNGEFVSENLAFDILAIAFEPGRGFEGHDRWAITVKVADRECCEIISLGSNAKRDEQLRKAQTHLERGGSLNNARLRRIGNAYYLADGER